MVTLDDAFKYKVSGPLNPLFGLLLGLGGYLLGYTQGQVNPPPRMAVVVAAARASSLRRPTARQWRVTSTRCARSATPTC